MSDTRTVDVNGRKIVIQAGVAIPRRQRAGKGFAAMLRAMQVGDSVLLENSDFKTAYGTARHLKIPVISRKEGDHVRMWRVEQWAMSS